MTEADEFVAELRARGLNIRKFSMADYEAWAKEHPEAVQEKNKQIADAIDAMILADFQEKHG